jgi:uncharacterized protein (TIGR00730 family)
VIGDHHTTPPVPLKILPDGLRRSAYISTHYQPSTPTPLPYLERGELVFDVIKKEAFGEDEKHRPQPIFEQEPTALSHDHYLNLMRATIDKLQSDKASRGDLKLLSRTLRELRYALKVFHPYRRRRKVTVFGSARTKPDHPAYQLAERYAAMMAKHDWMVITGAGPGIMEAGHKGAGREASMGLNIILPFEQSSNDFIEGDPKLVTLKYFFTRKLMFIKECSAVVCLPGGFGTLDEALEVLTLVQTGKQPILPIVFLDEPNGKYWSALEVFIKESLLGAGLVSPDDLNIFSIKTDAESAVEEVLGFYKVYHSMRYVDDQLVIRLNHRLSDDYVEALSKEFSNIVASGTLVQCGALEQEKNEPEIVELPRLCLHFNRRNFGRLRVLINKINASSK